MLWIAHGSGSAEAVAVHPMLSFQGPGPGLITGKNSFAFWIEVRQGPDGVSVESPNTNWTNERSTAVETHSEGHCQSQKSERIFTLPPGDRSSTFHPPPQTLWIRLRLSTLTSPSPELPWPSYPTSTKTCSSVFPAVIVRKIKATNRA
jgi:hypothetical protein